MLSLITFSVYIVATMALAVLAFIMVRAGFKFVFEYSLYQGRSINWPVWIGFAMVMIGINFGYYATRLSQSHAAADLFGAQSVISVWGGTCLCSAIWIVLAICSMFRPKQEQAIPVGMAPSKNASLSLSNAPASHLGRHIDTRA